MICTDTADKKMFHGQDPVSAMMSRLATGDGPPDLELLACAVADALPSLRQAQHLAIAIDPDRAAILDGNWTRRQNNCLIVGTDQPQRWAGLPSGWNSLVTTAHDQGGEVVQGQGTVPGGSPWTVLPGPDTGTWFLLPVTVLGLTVAVVLVETEPHATAADLQKAKAQLTAMGQALTVVTDLWARTISLTAELSQSRGEREAMSRLNRLQGRFVAMASHEFKTPLTSITAYTDVLRTQLTDDEFPHAWEFLDVIKTEADRLLRMVNRILDFTRMEYGAEMMTREPTALAPLVDDTVRGLRPAIEDKNLRVEVHSAANVPRAEINADLIRQVLVNLIGNAVKFTPREGSITVSIEETESAVAVSVADDGPGIAAKDVRRVFREFYRADGTTEREEGTGLGLTIARHIVNLHGGHIEVRRHESGGADFRFLVPKETGAADSLPLEMGSQASPTEVRSLVDELLRLIAELTGSRAVAVLLRDGNGALVPAGAMGWDTAACEVRPIIENVGWTRFMQAGRAVTDPNTISRDLNWCPDNPGGNQHMFAPLGAGDSTLGVVITGRRREKGNYSEADLAQLTILADVTKAALHGMNTSVGRTVEAVRLLLKIRRTGVPTSTPEALDLLARLARRLGVGETGTRRMQYAAALHDAGMARVEDEIVLGGSALDLDERDEVERHVEQGVDLMGPLLPDEATTDIIRHHHEKFDGTGYPSGLMANEIPLGARLLAVIDAWFSLTRDRSFREGLLPAAALNEIQSHVNTQFDPQVVQEFQAVLESVGILNGTPHTETVPNTKPTAN